ncbi:conserved protein of unknown function [Tenacibaculum sp. 190130A14a]|uniref:Uncharacterized protein n=2 Tax=Tenacibaculum polynesiense TaxID=3137857 RepID=A0ABM9PDA5_9FLAO
MLEIDLSGIFIFLFLIMLGPSLLFAGIGLALKKKKPKSSKVFFILAVVYLIISLGTCGSMMLG